MTMNQHYQPNKTNFENLKKEKLNFETHQE
jgi:hypothetical protein